MVPQIPLVGGGKPLPPSSPRPLCGPVPALRERADVPHISDLADPSINFWISPWAVLQTRESLSVVLRATYPENQVALTESK